MSFDEETRARAVRCRPGRLRDHPEESKLGAHPNAGISIAGLWVSRSPVNPHRPAHRAPVKVKCQCRCLEQSCNIRS